MGADNNMFRVGYVSSIDPERVTVRVVFSDKDNLPSYNLPILVPNTLRNKDYVMPDVGEWVLCCFLSNGVEQGFVMGSFYSASDIPPTTDPNKRVTKFDGGGSFEFDRSTGKLTINAPGGIEITTPEIITSGDTNIKGVSFIRHVHGGVTVGSGDTGKPK